MTKEGRLSRKSVHARKSFWHMKALIRITRAHACSVERAVWLSSCAKHIYTAHAGKRRSPTSRDALIRV